MMCFRLVGLVSVIATLAGCSGGGLRPRDPVEACEELCDVACASFVGDCNPDAVDPEQEQADCVAGCTDGAECERAVGLGDNYDECLEALDGGECRDPGGGTLPAACQGVILIEA